jgi:hypothetical protein
MMRRAPKAPLAQDDASQRTRDAGALYVHLQSENGVEHRTLILSPVKVRALRTLWSAWGVALLLAWGGSWLYFATQSLRIPVLNARIAHLETESLKLDTLQLRLQELQDQYDQVYRMLGATRADASSGLTKAKR